MAASVATRPTRETPTAPLRADEDLGEILQWKEPRKLTHNLTVHYKRHLYLVDDSPQARALRGKVVEVHELQDGTVKIRHRALELTARVFRKDGGVRQQDVTDNKYLATTLERVRKAQIANDVRQLRSGRLTKREKAALQASLGERATPEEQTAVAEDLPASDVPPCRLPIRSSTRSSSASQRSDWKKQIEQPNRGAVPDRPERSAPEPTTPFTSSASSALSRRARGRGVLPAS